MLTYIRTVYYLSFPVVIGAVLSNRMVIRLSGVDPVHWTTSLMLALVVFIIYTVDRLLDVRKYAMDSTGQRLTERHRFHYQYASLLWRLVAGVAVLAVILLFFLPPAVIRFGLILGGICVAYVGAVFRLPARHPALLLKEPLVAALYATGVWGSVWVQRPVITYVDLTEYLMFVGIAFQNLLLFAVMEQLETPDQSLFSLATQWGSERCNMILRWLTIAIVVAGLLLCFLAKDRFAQRSALVLVLMSIALYGIQRYPAYFLKNERYRWLGDGVFWMPGLVL
ncbi:hypothetical protein [Spirosoma luteum]|uniref:hypothetical protein n=1 Tax=Spirosoma luteum TaxID=431553 RepID=UPI000373FCE7|nr:hypothetical protein [Spirosoma luteum]